MRYIQLKGCHITVHDQIWTFAGLEQKKDIVLCIHPLDPVNSKSTIVTSSGYVFIPSSGKLKCYLCLRYLFMEFIKT